jgi:AraC family transcriptional regulator
MDSGADAAVVPGENRLPPQWLIGVRGTLDAAAFHTPRLCELATVAGVHPVHLARAFRSHFGCTPRGYVQVRRLAEAMRLLTETDMPLATIALRLGYHDQCHFTRAFKARTALTPGMFRARHRADIGDPSQAA